MKITMDFYLILIHLSLHPNSTVISPSTVAADVTPIAQSAVRSVAACNPFTLMRADRDGFRSRVEFEFNRADLFARLEVENFYRAKVLR